MPRRSAVVVLLVVLSGLMAANAVGEHVDGPGRVPNLLASSSAIESSTIESTAFESTAFDETWRHSDGADVGGTTGGTAPIRRSDQLVVETVDHVPVRIRIPAINLDTDIVAVGVDSVGDFAVPDEQVVGWYRYGSSPGDNGSAVLAAHVDFEHTPGAFFDLVQAVPGHTIEIEMDDGSTRLFEVVDHALYDKLSLPADDLFREHGPASLRLVTCGGRFDAGQRHYTGNRVVTAVPV